MYNPLQNILILGSFGMVYYWILRDKGLLINFQHKNDDERKSLSLIFVTINIFILNSLMNLTQRHWNFELYFISSFFITLFLLNYAISLMNKYLKKKKIKHSKQNKISNSFINLLRSDIEKEIGKYDKYILIFSLEGEFIDSGYIQGFDFDDGNFDFKLKKSEGDYDLDYNSYKEKYGVKNVYISFTRNIKVVLFDEERKV
ncbi:hypothetical protein ACQV2T_04195 [Facklamia sp. P13069]|uniref:hypothetical protein n=1 Tax=Facklamia sp. P13069 TaxID=3421954 RepID=UPI003D16AE17